MIAYHTVLLQTVKRDIFTAWR